MKEDFHLSYSNEIQGVPVKVYTSLRTGVKIINAAVNSPLVQGFFTLLTEETSDDGLPHTLEHLVFLGSKKYPYKGVLDSLANRCLANGTNAWTAVDHTAYTITTAGEEGFLNLLPIYIDHILNPTLLDSAFFTEVAYIDETGTWNGVVYSEMQSHENKRECLMSRSLLASLYPESGYCCETGGVLKNLRELTNEKVKNYHQKYYRWDNLAIIITGNVNLNNVLDIIKKEEDDYIKSTNMNYKFPYPYPWSSTLPSIKPSKNEIIYPSDENQGSVNIGWRTCSINDIRTLTALQILANYLSDTNESPLEQALVECPEPYCSSVDMSVREYKEVFLSLEIDDIPLEKLKEVEKVAIETIQNVYDNKLNMDRIKRIALQESMRFKQSIETDSHMSFAEIFIEGYLRGNMFKKPTNKDDKKTEPVIDVNVENWMLTERFNTGKTYEELSLETEDFWKNLIQEYILKNERCSVVGTPSKERASELHNETQDIISMNKERLGENGLKEIKEKMDAIKTEQNKKPPASIIDEFPVANIEKVKSVQVETVSNLQSIKKDNHNNYNYEKDSFINNVINKSKVPIIGVNYKSEFIRSNLTIRLPKDIVASPLLMHIYTSLILELPLSIKNCPKLLDNEYFQFLKGNDDFISHITVSSLLSQYTTECDTCIGINASEFIPGEYSQCLFIEFTCGKKYTTQAIALIFSLMLCLKIDEERLLSTAKASLASLKQKKQSGSQVRTQVESFLRKDIRHPRNVLGIAHQEKTLTLCIKNSLETTQQLSEIQLKIKEQILNGHFSLFLSGSLLDDSHPTIPFPSIDIYNILDFIVENNSTPSLTSINEYLELTNPSPYGITSDINTINKEQQVIVCGLQSLQSGYLMLTNNGLQYPNGIWGNKFEPVLSIICEYISVMEGILYKAVRGSGYSYGCDYFFRRSNGEISLSVAPAADIINGLKASLNVFDELYKISKEHKLLDNEFDSAKSSTLYSIIRKEENTSICAENILLNIFRGLSYNYNRINLIDTNKVTKEETEKTLFNIMKDWKSLSHCNDCKFKGTNTTLTVIVPQHELEHTVKEIRDIMKQKIIYGKSKDILKWISGYESELLCEENDCHQLRIVYNDNDVSDDDDEEEEDDDDEEENDE